VVSATSQGRVYLDYENERNTLTASMEFISVVHIKLYLFIIFREGPTIFGYDKFKE
jgi:hypothetical protein